MVLVLFGYNHNNLYNIRLALIHKSMFLVGRVNIPRLRCPLAHIGPHTNDMVDLLVSKIVSNFGI